MRKTLRARSERKRSGAYQGPMHHYHKDGATRFFQNGTGDADVYYEPNSFGGLTQDESYREPPLRILADADRFDHRAGNDDYGQPRALFGLFDAGQRERLFANIAAAMQGVPRDIVERQLGHFEQVHPDYAGGIREALVAVPAADAAE